VGKVHQEVKRIVPGSDRAILFIHGILGTPDHFLPFLELVPPKVSVYNLLLDGHGRGVRDSSRSSMTKWETQVGAAVRELSRSHREIVIAAHSLGALLAMGQAVQCPQITRLFLLATPLRLSLKLPMVTNSLQVYFDRIRPGDGPALAAKRCCGITHSPNPLLYLGWIPRFWELFQKIAATRQLIPSLQIPCAVYLSARDEMVSLRSRRLLEANPRITVTLLPSSGHFYYPPEDMAQLAEAFRSFLFL
jgi:esterase/lipase